MSRTQRRPRLKATQSCAGDDTTSVQVEVDMPNRTQSGGKIRGHRKTGPPPGAGLGRGYGNGSAGDSCGYMRFRWRYLRSEYSASVSGESRCERCSRVWMLTGRTVPDILAQLYRLLYLLRVGEIPVLWQRMPPVQRLVMERNLQTHSRRAHATSCGSYTCVGRPTPSALSAREGRGGPGKRRTQGLGIRGRACGAPCRARSPSAWSPCSPLPTHGAHERRRRGRGWKRQTWARMPGPHPPYAYTATCH